MSNDTTLLELKNLKKYFDVKDKGCLHAVDDVSFTVREGETVGLVGESGCGKSTVGNVIMQLEKPTGGAVLYRGQNIFETARSDRAGLQKKMQMIFQDPFSSLNPKKVVRMILEEPYKIHKIAKGEELEARVRELIGMVGMEPYMLEKYPHELDGGGRQLVGIARAIALNPEFVVCDEPVSSLDVSIQATIINLLMDLQAKYKIAYLFISHDLSVVRHISKRIVVMYLGEIVEMAETEELFKNTFHPYSVALLSAVPSIDLDNRKERIVLSGDVPNPINPKPGCRFAPRCWKAEDRCFKESPALTEVSPWHFVACHCCDGQCGGKKSCDKA